MAGRTCGWYILESTARTPNVVGKSVGVVLTHRVENRQCQSMNRLLITNIISSKLSVAANLEDALIETTTKVSNSRL
jgi:hypothetical protein